MQNKFLKNDEYPPSEDTFFIANNIENEKGDYALSNAVLTLDTAPASGEKLAVHITTASVHDGTSGLNQQFTGDGSTVAFTVTTAPVSEATALKETLPEKNFAVSPVIDPLKNVDVL